MKKHIFRMMIVMLFACLGLTAFVACAPEENKETFTVTYAAGEGTGTAPASEKHAEGETFTVAENTFTYEGYTFKTWNDGTKDVAVGATYTMPAKDVTFTAQWTKNATPVEKVTVTFSLGDYTTGTAPVAQEVEKGAQVTLPEAPAWAGHTFKGWKVGADATLKQAGDKITVSENVTVIAQWEASIDGYWTTTGVGIDLPGMEGPFDVEIALREDGSDHLYAIFKLTKGQTFYIDAMYIEKGASAWQYYNFITITLQDGKLHVKIQNIEFDLAAHTDFTDEFTPTGTYSATVSGSEHYMDFDQWGYDSGNGYMDDVDFVTVGKYVAVFESTPDDILNSLAVLIAGESGAIEGYNDEGKFATFAACDVRAKTFAFTSLELEEEGGKVYLIGNGTYTGTTASQFLALMEDAADDQEKDTGFNFSFYCAGHREYEADWENVENTADRGTFMVKLDVTELNLEKYSILANNSGYGDLKFPAATDEKVVSGNKIYTLRGAAGANAYLEIGDSSTDWTGVSAAPTGITLTLNDAKDKVLLTVSGTYTGTTKEHMKELLSQKYNTFDIVYFWGPDNNAQEGKDLVITTTDSEWTVQVDVTELKSDIYDNNQAEGTVIQNATPGDGINGRENTSPGINTEFQVKSIVDTTVECGGRTFTLVQSGLYGHNTLYIGTPVTLTYDLNGWTEGTVPAPVKLAKSANVVLAKPEAREGYFFKGWKVGTDEKGDVIKQAGERFAVSADVTITAVWASDAVSGIWTYTKDSDTTKLYVANCEGGIIVVLETETGKEAMFFSLTDMGWACGSKTLTVDGSSLVLKAEQTTTFTGRTAFAAGDAAEVPEDGVYSFKAADKDALYVDFGYEAIDLGEGYLDDAEFATVGKFVVALVEKNGAKQGPVFEVAESGDITAYNATASMALTACEARAKNVVLTLFTLAAEGEKAYLTMSGTYVGFKPSELYELSDDEEYNILNISVFLNHGPWTTYPNPTDPATQIVSREHTIGEGKISAKLDITQLPVDTYGLAPRNDGKSDCAWGSNTPQEITIGNRKYALGPNGANAQLSVNPVGTVVANSVTIGLDNPTQATKVLLTIKGTYTGMSKADVEGILSAATIISFWGSKGQNATCTSTVDENGTWTIVVDITNLQDDGDMAIITSYYGAGKINNTNNGTEFHFDWVQDQSVTFQGKTYSLKKTGGAYGHNCVSVKAAAE